MTHILLAHIFQYQNDSLITIVYTVQTELKSSKIFSEIRMIKSKEVDRDEKDYWKANVVEILHCGNNDNDPDCQQRDDDSEDPEIYLILFALKKRKDRNRQEKNQSNR